MPKCAFIVDGFLEVGVLSRLCGGSPARRLNLNANSVTVDSMAKRAASIIRLLNNKYYPIHIIIDRENRDESCAALELAFSQAIAAYGVQLNQMTITFCDRMIENWILADRGSLERRFGSLPAYQSEGSHGKGVLRSLINNGTVAYDEASLGVELLSAADAAEICRNSASFRSLVGKWQGDCWWLEKALP